MSAKKILESLKRLNEGSLSQEDKANLEDLISDAMGEECYGFEWNGDTVSFEWEVARDSDYEEDWPYKPNKPKIPGYKVTKYKVDGAIEDSMSTISITMTLAKMSDKEMSDEKAKERAQREKLYGKANVLITDPETSSKELDQVAKDAEKLDYWDVRKLAAHPNISLETMKYLFSLKETGLYHAITAGLATNPNTTPEIFHQLWKICKKQPGKWFNEYNDTAYHLATNPSIPEDVLWDIVKDNRDWRCRAAADNPVATKEMLEYISKRGYSGQFDYKDRAKERLIRKEYRK